MRSKTTKCIILGHKAIGEGDKLVYLYSDEFGKLKAIAKGASKLTSKFTGFLETLATCHISLYFGPKRIIITEISSDEFKQDDQKNLNKMTAKLHIAEITNKLLPEANPLPGLETLINKAKNHLNTCKRPLLILTAYLVKFLDKVGILPDFREINSRKIEIKYLKFFQFLKEKHFSEIDNITLTQKEEQKIKEVIKKIIENETNLPVNFL